MENINEKESKKEENELKNENQNITDTKNEPESAKKIDKIKEENKKEEEEKNNKLEEMKENNDKQNITIKKDEKNKINENIKLQIEKFFNDVLSKTISVWENDNKNFGYYYKKELYDFLISILRNPCVFVFKDQVTYSFKFLCNYLSYFKDKLDKIPVFCMFIIDWFFSYKVNLFSLYPKNNYMNEFDEQNELIGDNYFYIILKEIWPEIKIENPQLGYSYNSMLRYILEYLLQIGFFDNYLNVFLEREELEPYSYITFTEYVFHVLNYCEDSFIEKNNKNYNSFIISNFTKRINFYSQNFDLYMKEGKESKERYINFVKYIVHNYYPIIFGGLGRIFEKYQKEGKEEEMDNYILSIFSLYELLLKQQKLEFRILAMDSFNILVNYYKIFDEDDLKKTYYSPKKVYEYTKKKFISFLEKLNIFELIFGENIHEALIERSNDIIVFLYKNNIFKKEQISFLWKISKSKSQSINSSIITLLSRILPEFSNEDSDIILKEISSIPLKEVNDTTMKLLENFFVSDNRNENLLNILFKYSNELSFNEGLSENIINKSRNILVKILFNKEYKNDLFHFMKNCLFGLSNNYLINTHRNILIEIINEFNKNEKDENTLEIFKLIDGSISNFQNLIKFLDEKFLFFTLLMENLFFVKKFLIFLVEEGISIKKIFDEDISNFNEKNELDIEKIMNKYIEKNLKKELIDSDNNTNQKNEINTDNNKENEIRFNNDSLPKNSKDIINYHKQIIMEYIDYLKKNILIKAKKLTENDLINNIFTNFEFSYEKKTYQKILSNTLDTIFSFHEFSDTCINPKLINFIYELLVNNCLYKEEKNTFFNFIKNIFVYQFGNYNLKLLEEETIDNICLLKIPSNEITSLPYSAYESINLYMIYKNEKNGNIEYSHDINKFKKIKKIKLLIGFQTLLNFYINNNNISIAINALDTLTNIIEIASSDMINRKYILTDLFSLLENYQKNKKENITPLRRILRLISIINRTKVTENLYDKNDPKNILELKINNDFYSNNNQDNIQEFHAFKGLTIKEFKEELIDNLICCNANDLIKYNYYNQNPHTMCSSLPELKNEIIMHDLIVLYYNDKILKNQYTLSEYGINSGEIILLLNKGAMGLNEDEFTLTEEQLKEGYEQIKVVFNDKFSEDIMKEALIKNKGDVQNTIIFLTEENNVESIKTEVERQKKEEPKKIEEQFCLEEHQFNLLLDILNEEDSQLNDTIWDLFSEIKFQDEFISDNIEKLENILEEKNLNKIILILKIINSVIFDDKTFCKNNQISKEQKNKWISKFVNNKEFICRLLKFLSQYNKDEISEKNYFDIINLFMNYFKIIFSDLVELIKVDNQNNIINENENINKNFLKFDIQEKDMKSFIQILSENNFISYLYKIFSNITSCKNYNVSKKAIIENIFDIELKFLKLNPKEVQQLLNEEKESKNLLTMLTSEKNLEIRKLTLDFIKQLINELNIKNNDDYKINIQTSLLQYYYPYLISEEIYYEQFYELYNYLFNIKQVESNVINIQEIISKIFEYLYTFYSNNKNPNISDVSIDKIKNKIKYNLYILSCFSPLYDELIKKEIDSNINENKDVTSILYDCLFNIQKFEENKMNYIFSEDKLRENTFQILSNIMSLDKKYFDIICLRIIKLHTNIILKKSELPLSSPLRNFNSNKYLGLKNFGATCYLNSLFQQLYMLPTFYTDIFNINISDKITEIKNLEENTLYQTQLTFANLLKSIMSVYPPYSFIKSFKSAFNGEPIKFGVQQDADEFLSILCDKLENEAKILNKENFLENSFKGKITNEIVSLETEYPYYSQTDESFYSITVDIKNHKTLEDALNSYVKGEILEGENKFFVEKYKKKISIKKRTSLKKIGNQIIIHLKRFEFDFYTFENNKLNDYLKFPMQLNLKKWTRAFIRQNELNNNENDIKEEEKENLDENKMQYELTGILIHSGANLQSGHYYSLIKSQEDNKWYKFNDNEITEYNIEKDLEKDCFGNLESKVNQYGKGAYLLFYTKKECLDKYKNFDKKSIINENILKEIENENISFLKIKTFTNNLYHKFFIKFINNANKYLSLSEKENKINNTSLMNKNLHNDILIYEKMLKYLEEKKINIDMNNPNSFPKDIIDIYNNIKNDINNKNVTNELNDMKEINLENIINLFCFYFFGIVLQYNEDKEEIIKDCMKIINDMIKKNSILSLNVMKIIESNSTIFTDLLFKFGYNDKRSNLKNDINNFVSNLFISCYQLELNDSKILNSESYNIFFIDELGNIRIKKAYKSLYLRLFKIIFCENLEKSRKDYIKNSLFLELFYSLIKSNPHSNIVASEYLITLVTLISNNTIQDLTSEINPNIKMDNPNNYYLKIFSQVILTCATPSMIYLQKASPYLLLKLDDINKYPQLSNDFDKIYIPDFIIYYVLSNNSDFNLEEMICHLCWENELISFKIMFMINNFLKTNYYPYPFTDNVFFNAIKIFNLNDSFTHKRLETLFELEDDDKKTLINFYYENRYKLYVLVPDALYFIAKAIEKYNNVFEYFKKNKNKVEWVKQYYVELIENKFNISLLVQVHPDLYSIIEEYIINKLEL